MSLLSWWKRWRGEEVPIEGEQDDEPEGPIRLPSEPFVFECGQCGKVFEARRKHPMCPECDSDEVEELS